MTGSIQGFVSRTSVPVTASRMVPPLSCRASARMPMPLVSQSMRRTLHSNCRVEDPEPRWYWAFRWSGKYVGVATLMDRVGVPSVVSTTTGDVKVTLTTMISLRP